MNKINLILIGGFSDKIKALIYVYIIANIKEVNIYMFKLFKDREIYPGVTLNQTVKFLNEKKFRINAKHVGKDNANIFYNKRATDIFENDIFKYDDKIFIIINMIKLYKYNIYNKYDIVKNFINIDFKYLSQFQTYENIIFIRTRNIKTTENFGTLPINQIDKSKEYYLISESKNDLLFLKNYNIVNRNENFYYFNQAKYISCDLQINTREYLLNGLRQLYILGNAKIVIHNKTHSGMLQSCKLFKIDLTKKG